MPWKIDENNCVVRADTGKQMHCYPKTPEGKAQAEKYLKALYANAPEKKQLIRKKPCSGCLSHKELEIILKAGRGNMAGLAKHISHLVGKDPDFHKHCTDNAEVQKISSEGGYDINALCAKAHKLVVGEWPGGQSNEGNEGARAKKEANWIDKLLANKKRMKISFRKP